MFGFSYWFLPLFAACVWLGTLLAMIGTWAAMGKPHYAWEAVDQHIPYISDIGATYWGKPLFIVGSAVMVVTFDLAFISERWLRHKARLAPNYNVTEKILSAFAILFAVIGAIGLIMLTIFDTRRHHRVHDAMLCVFIGGYIVSAVFICAEYQRLGIHFRQHRHLRISFWVKLAFILVELALAISFGVLSDRKTYNNAAVVEWVVSAIYIFYVLSFIIDFLPAVHTKSQDHRFPAPVRRSLDEHPEETEKGGNILGGPVYSGGGHDHANHAVAQPEPASAAKNF